MAPSIKGALNCPDFSEKDNVYFVPVEPALSSFEFLSNVESVIIVYSIGRI